MSKLDKIKKAYWACKDCNEEAGGVFPENHICTMRKGKCEICGTMGTFIPWVDYNWPKKDDNFQAHMTRD